MKYNNFKLIVYFLMFVVVGLLAYWFFLGNKNPVEATHCIGHTYWGNWQYKETLTKCEPVAECGTSEGVKTIKEKRECKWSNACGESECKFNDKQYREVEVGCEVELVECEPEVTPTPTPTPEPTPVVHDNPASNAGAPQCTSTRPVLLPANPLVWRKAGQAIVQWVPTEGEKANVYYREVGNYDNAHAVRDTENDGYVEIGLLGSLDWEFGIQQANDCAGGDVVWIEDGNTAGWTLFLP